MALLELGLWTLFGGGGLVSSVKQSLEPGPPRDTSPTAWISKSDRARLEREGGGGQGYAPPPQGHAPPYYPPQQQQLNRAAPSHMRPTDRSVRVTQKDNLGHFYADVEINGHRFPAMVDSGATMVALCHAHAQGAGLNLRSLNYNRRSQTAGGMKAVAVVRIPEITVNGITRYDVDASISKNDSYPGSLLGKSFLSKLSSANFTPDTLILTP